MIDPVVTGKEPGLAVTTERLPNSRMSLEIEVDPDRVEQHMERAAKRISQQVRIPGFRPGKAPRKTLERHVGSAALLQEALEELVPEVYNEALETESIDAIDQPEFNLKSTEPLVVTATVPVRPTVDLGDYQSLRVPKPEVSVDEEQIEETLLNVRRQYAVLEPVDRPVAWDDHIRADVTVNIEGQDPHTEEDAEFALREGGVISLPGFAERLIGLERGGPHTIEVVLPEDFASADLAGKTATYELTIHEVKQEVLPDLDDEFVQSLDEEGLTTVQELRDRVTADLREQLEHRATEEYHNEIIDLLVATATLDYPEVLVEREIDRGIDRESNHASHTPEGLQNWLNAIGQTEDEVRDALREAADLTVRRALVLGELVDAESVEVSDEQIEEELDRVIEQMTGGSAQNAEAFRGLFDTADGRASIRNQLLTRFAVERLEEICSQPEDEAGAPRRASRRRRSGASAEASDDSTEVSDEADEASEGASET
jgi:trigger factor